ncbi:MAG: hypothetical protein UD963_09950 [Christensenellales bacterium]|nr:hypothetical protein [Christensenellales bacterium]
MENQSPFTAEPFATKRSDGKVEVCLTTYKSWLPMFYLLPKEYVQKRSVYLSLPRCPYAIWNTHQYDELVNSDAFLEMIWDSYAWAIWNCFLVPDKTGKRKWMPTNINYYSGNFPLWRLAYTIMNHIRKKLEDDQILTFSRLLCLRPGMEFSWCTTAQFDALVCTLTLKIIEEQHWQPMIDELWLNRTVEDFDETRVSRERIDSYRKWHHTRTNVGTPVSMEQIQEDCEDGMKDIADPDSEFEHEVLNELRLKSFMETLSERDREILNLKMQGMTDQKIAEKVGFKKNHSAVVKRRKQIAEHFQKYVENE